MATEQMVWLSSTDPQAMLRYLTNNGLVSDRQLRMFVEAVTGIHVWVNLGADFDWLGFANEVITSEHAKHHPSLSVQAALLREIFGNPFRPEDLNRIVINSPVGPGTITGYNSHGQEIIKLYGTCAWQEEIQRLLEKVKSMGGKQT